jgi:hypothetical protein
MIESGRQVVAQLDSDGIKVAAAFWFLLAEKDSWKLMLLLPELITQGPRAAYRAVQKSLSRITGPTLTLDATVVLEPDSPLILQLRSGIRGSGISGLRFSKNVVAGNLIEDAYIYRLT